jgi:hypothetical protein
MMSHRESDTLLVFYKQIGLIDIDQWANFITGLLTNYTLIETSSTLHLSFASSSISVLFDILEMDEVTKDQCADDLKHVGMHLITLL